MAALVLLVGCAEFLDLPDDPAVVPLDPWICAKSPLQQGPPASDKATVRVQVRDFTSSNWSRPVTGLTATLCETLDVDCSTPVEGGIQDANGDLTFQVPTSRGGSLGYGFEGYLQIMAASELCTTASVFAGYETVACMLAPQCDQSMPDERCRIPTFARTLLFFNPPVVNDVIVPIVLPMIPSLATFALLSAAGAVAASPTDGSVVVNVVGCDGLGAAGVTLSLLPSPSHQVTSLYFVDGVLDKSAMETDASGFGGLVGVPAGFQRIVASTSGPDAREIGRVGIQVQPLAASYVTIVPTSR